MQDCTQKCQKRVAETLLSACVSSCPQYFDVLGTFLGVHLFGEWCPDPAHIAASVIQSAMKAAGLCVCRKRHCGGVGVFVSARLFTHSLACWNSFVMKLIAPQWTRGFPGSWEFNESDGWSADRISLSVDGGISPEITEIYWLISSMRSNFTASTLSFFPAPWCAELPQPAKQAFEWRGKQLSHLFVLFWATVGERSERCQSRLAAPNQMEPKLPATTASCCAVACSSDPDGADEQPRVF